MNRIFAKYLVLLTLLPVLVSCSGRSPTPVPLPSFTASLTSSTQAFTSTPTNTLAPTPTPAPTRTLVPTRSPTPHPAQVFAAPILEFIQSRSPNYQDDFSNSRSGWDIRPTIIEESCCYGSARYRDGEYVAIAEPAKPGQLDGFNWAWGSNDKLVPAMSNYVIEIEQRVVSGRSLAGIYLCDDIDLECFNTRLWSPDILLDFWGESLHSERPRHEFLTQLPLSWVTDLGQPTTLMVVKKGLEIAVYVNRQLAYYLLLDEKYQRRLDFIQLRVGNDSVDTAAEVHWDNLKIWVLNP